MSKKEYIAEYDGHCAVSEKSFQEAWDELEEEMNCEFAEVNFYEAIPVALEIKIVPKETVVKVK